MARNARDLKASQALRYKVFVEEMGANSPTIDHNSKIEADLFDPFFDHLLLIDEHRNQDAFDYVVGVYRLLRSDVAKRNCGFYSQSEFDLSPLVDSGRSLVELGRSCVHPDYRGGLAMLQLWNGLADYVLSHQIEIMFGVASFPGVRMEKLAQPLAYLHHHHLAPVELRVRAQGENFAPMDHVPINECDPRKARALIPPLIQSYLRLGGFVGDGAFIDYGFNTIDVCLVMDTERMSRKHRDRFVENWARL